MLFSAKSTKFHKIFWICYKFVKLEGNQCHQRADHCDYQQNENHGFKMPSFTYTCNDFFKIKNKITLDNI